MKFDKLNLIAPINQLGYGVASLNILRALCNQGIEVSLFPIGGPQSIHVTNIEDATLVRNCINSAEKSFSNKAPSIRIWHQNDLAQHVGRGPHVGFPIFELDTFTEQERHHLSSCDALFVCSEWAKKVVQDNIGASGVESGVHVVPLGVDSTIFMPTNPVKKDKIVFFNCGKWEVRKGHDILIEAFKIAHSRCKNIELHMMCTNPFNSPQEESSWRTLYNHEAVKIIPRAETQRDVYKYMAYADCGIFPSRAEGWNLELLEMMSVGRHVIATDYSAHTEFCNEHNSTLIPIKTLEHAYDNKWFFGHGKWAQIDEDCIEHIANAMVGFAKSYRGVISENGINTAARFSWDATGSKFVESLRRLYRD
jgi:glycosyltransferase involved in cell wall biosynthesis